MARAAVALAGCASLSLCLLAASRARADEVGSALYVRTDSDKTTVVSPRARGQKRIGEATEVEATYAADVWTSASIDIRTSASVQVVTEQRDEVDVGVTHELEDLTLHAGYRLSIENDYDSNGLSASGAYDFADNAATLTLSLNAIHDVVGRSGDEAFGRQLDTLNTRLSLLQVIDPNMLATVTYELAVLDGYQASPYRFVGIAGTGFGCVDAGLCLQEQVPELRLRHAFVLMLRRALGEAVSLGATYRFYLDDWGLSSHTLLGELGWNAGEHTLIGLHYRFYSQSGVSFYRAVYAAAPAVGEYITRDRELSPSGSHRLGLDLDQTVSFDDGRELTFSLDLAGASFSYDDFVGLSSVRAFELTTAVALSF